MCRRERTGAVVLTASDVQAVPDTTVIPDEQVNSDWNATTGKAVILNKPTIPTVSYPVTSVNAKTGAVVLSASDVGAPTTTGTGASGNWAINVTGNAATATSAASANAVRIDQLTTITSTSPWATTTSRQLTP